MKTQTRILDNRLYYTRKIELHRKGKKYRTIRITQIVICYLISVFAFSLVTLSGATTYWRRGTGDPFTMQKKLQNRILRDFHTGHPGINRMKSLMKSNVYWPNMGKVPTTVIDDSKVELRIFIGPKITAAIIRE